MVKTVIVIDSGNDYPWKQKPLSGNVGRNPIFHDAKTPPSATPQIIVFQQQKEMCTVLEADHHLSQRVKFQKKQNSNKIQQYFSFAINMVLPKIFSLTLINTFINNTQFIENISGRKKTLTMFNDTRRTQLDKYRWVICYKSPCMNSSRRQYEFG